MKKRRKCLNCRCLFAPDPRNATRQRYCGEPDCRRASKAASQHRWLAKPENRDYFRGPHPVARVQAWRQAHPDYARQRRLATACALQEPLTAQALDLPSKNDLFAAQALQEALHTQAFVLTGLIATFSDLTLQDEIARATDRLLRLGRDIVGGPSPP